MSHLKLTTSPDTYALFLDMLEVEELFLVEQVVNQAIKHPNNPVIGLGNVEDWDSSRVSNWAASILYDEKDSLFKAWYFGRDRQNYQAIGYAESHDGVFWCKPKLGLYEYNSSFANNICFEPPKRGMASHFCVAIDPKEPDPNRRYQALTWMEVPGKGNRYVPHYSPDGIHWTQASDGVSWPNGDTGQILIDEKDAPERRFKAYGQHNSGAGPDIEGMKPSDALLISPQGGCEHEIHFVYVLPYHDYYVMLYDFNRYRPYYGHTGYGDQPSLGMTRQERVKGRVALNRGNLPKEEPQDEYGIYTGDIRLAVSRNGTGRFSRIQPHKPVVPRGERNEWDSGFLVLGGGSMIVHDEMIYIYYTGVNEDTASGFPGAVPGPITTGLAFLRKDGFTYLQAQDVLTPGVMTTKSIVLREPARAHLVLNVSHVLPWRDWIEVEALDATTGKPIPGYSRKEAVPVFSEGLSVPVEWNEQKTLAGVEVPQIKLRFYFYGRAQLYSFTFVNG